MDIPRYRVSVTDRVVGAPTTAPDNFTVVNLSNLKTFVAMNGVWTLGSTIPVTISTIWRIGS